MSDGMRRELAYLSSHATNRYFIPNWGNNITFFLHLQIYTLLSIQPLKTHFLTNDHNLLTNSNRLN